MTPSMMLVRAGARSALVAAFRRLGVVSVNWDLLGDLTDVHSADEITHLVTAAYSTGPTWRPSKHYLEIADFVLGLPAGTLVLTVDTTARTLLVGTVVGPYEYWPKSALIEEGRPHRHVHEVDWQYEINRDDLDADALRDIDQRKTAYWLRPHTVAAITSARRTGN